MLEPVTEPVMYSRSRDRYQTCTCATGGWWGRRAGRDWTSIAHAYHGVAVASERDSEQHEDRARARRREAARRARGMLSCLAPGRMVTDELIAERRAQARREAQDRPPAPA